MHTYHVGYYPAQNADPTPQGWDVADTSVEATVEANQARETLRGINHRLVDLFVRENALRTRLHGPQDGEYMRAYDDRRDTLDAINQVLAERAALLREYPDLLS